MERLCRRRGCLAAYSTGTSFTWPVQGNRELYSDGATSRAPCVTGWAVLDSVSWFPARTEWWSWLVRLKEDSLSGWSRPAERFFRVHNQNPWSAIGPSDQSLLLEYSGRRFRICFLLSPRQGNTGAGRSLCEHPVAGSLYPVYRDGPSHHSGQTLSLGLSLGLCGSIAEATAQAGCDQCTAVRRPSHRDRAPVRRQRLAQRRTKSCAARGRRPDNHQWQWTTRAYASLTAWAARRGMKLYCEQWQRWFSLGWPETR